MAVKDDRWSVTTLKDCADWYSGGTPSTSVPGYWNGDIPWITASSLHDFYIKDSERRVTPLGVANGTRLMPKDTILFVVRGMSLKTEFRVGITRRPMAFGQDCKALVAKDGVDPLFLANVLRAKAEEILGFVDEASHGTGRLATDAIQKLEILLPPLDEQKAIAHILGTLDDKIELNQQTNHTLESIARALFKSWFIDFDPVRAKVDGRQPAGMDTETAALFPDEFEDSPLGKIPKGWKVKKIEDIAARVAMGPFGSRITSDNFVPFGVPVIRGNNLVNGFNEDTFVYLTEEKADELKSSVAFPGDIVFTHRGTLGQVGIIPQNSIFPRYVVSQSQMFLSVDKKEVSSKLVYHFFCLPCGQQALLANTNTTGVPSIARPSTSLKAIQLVVPSKEISDKFETLVNSFDAKRELDIQEIKNLTSIRDFLLPKLLSGEIRVKNAEKVVEAVA